MRYLAVLPLVVTAILTFSSDTHAAWTYDGTVVGATTGSAYISSIVPDDEGGAIIAWQDSRSGDTDIYVQRIDGFGVTQWTPNGVAVCIAANSQESPKMVSDGAGGAIIVWEDGRAGGDEAIYVQRVNSAGVPQWTANGVALCTAVDIQFFQEIASDGAGGAIVTWIDARNGNYDIYARRVNSAGAPQWTADGVAVCVLANAQLYPQIVTDTAGGAIIAWQDSRAGSVTHIYAQRLNASGAPQWTANGVLVSGTFDDQYNVAIAADGFGGAIMAWQDERLTATVPDIFVGRIDAAGNLPWGDGIAVSTAAQHQQSPTLVSDGAGGVIVAWESYVSGIEYDIYAQRVNQTGVPMWTYDGVPVCTVSGSQELLGITADGAGGAVVVWEDTRFGNNSDIYARRLDPFGTSAWQFDGMPICGAFGDQQFPLIVADGSGGVIMAWSDGRSGSVNAYAQRAELRYGYWGRPEPTIDYASDNPGDEGGSVIVRWRASQRDRFDIPAISHYSVWRATDGVRVSVIGSASATVTDPRDIPADFTGTAIWVRETGTTAEYWEWIANQNAFYQSTYSIVAPTRQDEMPGIPAPHAFKIIAHENQGPLTRVWESGEVTVSSIDNLSPPAPIQLTGERAGSGSVFLAWKAGGTIPDFLQYRIYRSGEEAVEPLPQYLYTSTESPTYVDAAAPSGALHYVVTAVDIHRNEGPPSNMVGVFDATDVGGSTPSIAALTLLPNRPNPFTGTTELRIGLPADADIAIEIYDVAGRRVNAFEVKGGAGWQSVRFAGRDDAGRPLASGVYFCRVTAAGKRVTNKMVIAR